MQEREEEEGSGKKPQSMQLAISFMFVKCLFIALRMLRLLRCLHSSHPPTPLAGSSRHNALPLCQLTTPSTAYRFVSFRLRFWLVASPAQLQLLLLLLLLAFHLIFQFSHVL